MPSATVMIPNAQVELTIEQLIAAMRQLEPIQKKQVARALAEDELDTELTNLIAELYSKPPVTDISDANILNEVQAVRQRRG